MSNCSDGGHEGCRRHKIQGGAKPALVAAYRKCCSRSLRALLSRYKRMPTYRNALRAAALGEGVDSGKKHPHQYRLRESAQIKFHRRLGFARLKSAQTFEELHLLVEEVGRPIDGIGTVAIYDAALRLGAFLGLPPRMVYLHAGTRVGATKILGGRLGMTAPKSAFPSSIRRLSAAEIEDFLCIYKDLL